MEGNENKIKQENQHLADWTLERVTKQKKKKGDSEGISHSVREKTQKIVGKCISRRKEKRERRYSKWKRPWDVRKGGRGLANRSITIFQIEAKNGQTGIVKKAELEMEHCIISIIIVWRNQVIQVTSSNVMKAFMFSVKSIDNGQQLYETDVQKSTI